MIRSFRCRDTEAVFQRHRVARWGMELQQTARRKLVWLDAAKEIVDLRVPPGNRLEKLAGNRRGQWSIRVNDQWRLCFEWREGHAWGVELVDYH